MSNTSVSFFLSPLFHLYPFFVLIQQNRMFHHPTDAELRNGSSCGQIEQFFSKLSIQKPWRGVLHTNAARFERVDLIHVSKHYSSSTPPYAMVSSGKLKQVCYFYVVLQNIDYFLTFKLFFGETEHAKERQFGPGNECLKCLFIFPLITLKDSADHHDDRWANWIIENPQSSIMSCWTFTHNIDNKLSYQL